MSSLGAAATVSQSDQVRRRAVSDLTSENTSNPTMKRKEMPVTRTIERNSTSLPNSPQRNFATPAHLTNQNEDTDVLNGKTSTKRNLETPRRNNMMIPKSTASTLAVPNVQTNRRGLNGDHLIQLRGRSNTDVQVSSTSNGNSKQQYPLNGLSNEKNTNQYFHHPSGSNSIKPKCLLPTTTCQPGYVTHSKLFNMMGYGIQNQYLFMLAHYLYIIDCRTKEKFNDSHIVTAIHWEDALNGNVYISVVERFTEIVLYDEKGIFFNTTTEMRRVNNRFSTNGTKTCVTLSGGFEAFHTFYPFACTQTEVRSIIDREKFLTIYPSVILENQLYLGSGLQGTNWKIIRDLKLTHIINISVEHQCVYSDRIKYLHLEYEDVEEAPLNNHFDESNRFIESAFELSGSRVLVHCNLGISRSSTIVLAYLMKTYNANLLEAFKFLRHRRPVVCPNVGFVRQLVQYENDLFGHSYTDANDPIFH